MNWILRPDKTLHVGENFYKVQVGAQGFIASDQKKEGDFCTPYGKFPLRVIYYRADRITLPEVNIPSFPISENDIWCDDPNDQHYNQFLRLTENYPSSHEKLWRNDNIYDIIITIGYNDQEYIPGRGSAIFIHASKPDLGPTAGCIALEVNELLSIVPSVDINSCIEIIGEDQTQ